MTSVKVLCVVCGLPAAGKSTLCRSLSVEEGVDWIRFDDDIDVDDFDASRWHESRRVSLARVRKSVEDDAHRVVYVDDNAQYTSMRYALFKIARDADCAYATVLVDVDLETALARNRNRKEAVPEATMRRMALQLEPPDAAKHPWERHSIVSKGDDVDQVRELVAKARRDPGDYRSRRRCAGEEDKEESRRATSASESHQIDLALRRIVGEVATSSELKRIENKATKAAVTQALSKARKQTNPTSPSDVAETFSLAFRKCLSSSSVVPSELIDPLVHVLEMRLLSSELCV